MQAKNNCPRRAWEKRQVTWFTGLGSQGHKIVYLSVNIDSCVFVIKSGGQKQNKTTEHVASKQLNIVLK